MDNKTTSSLEFKVNAREVQQLGPTIKKAFDTKPVDDAKRKVGGLRSELEKTQEAIEEIAKALSQVERGSKAFDRLKEDLKRATSEAKLFTDAMKAGERAGAPPGIVWSGITPGAGLRSHGPPPPPPPPPPGAFGASGVAGQLKAGLGSAFKGYGGAAMSGAGQLGMPSAGALAAGMGAVPVLGGLAAGGFMAAATTYSSRLRYEQALKGAAPFLMDDAASFHMVPGERRRYADMQALEGMTGMPVTGGGASPGAAASRMAYRNLAYQGIGDGSINLPVDPFTYEHGPATPSHDLSFSAIVEAGRKYGLTPDQALEQAAGYSKAAGKAQGGQGFETAMAMQQVFGIGPETVGRGVQGARWTGQDSSAVVKVVSEGFRLGLRGSELVDHVEKQTQMMHEAGARGGAFTTEGMLRLQSGLAGAGVAGHRLGDITSQLGSSGAQLGFEGPKGATDFRMLYSLGGSPNSRESMFQAMIDAQDPGKMGAAFPKYMQSFAGSMQGAGTAQRTWMTQRAAAPFVRLGVNDAGAIAGGFGLGQAGGGMTEGDIRNAGGMLAGATAPNLIAEAGLEAMRIQVGGEIAETMRQFEEATLRVAGIFTDNLAGASETLANAFVRAAKGFDAGLDLLLRGNVEIRGQK